MKKLKGKNWDINTDTNTINIYDRLTTEQLARIVDSAADYERSLSINSERDSINWTINISEPLLDETEWSESVNKAIEQARVEEGKKKYMGPGIPPMKKEK